MKPIFLLISLICSVKSIGQNVFSIDIDFKNKSFSTIPKGKELRKFDQVIIKVKDLPAGQYKININKTDSSISAGNEPALFGLLKFGDGFNSILGGLSAYAVRAVPVGADKGTYIKQDPDRKPAGEDNKNQHLPTKKAPKDPCSLEFSSNYSVKELQDKMRHQVLNFHFTFRDSVIKTADQLYTLLDLNPINSADTSKIRTAAMAIIQKRLDFEKYIEGMYTNYYDEILINERYKAITECGYLRAADSMLVNYKKSFNAYLTGFDTVFNEARMVKEYNRLKAPKTMEYISLPLNFKSDITRLAIDINGVDAAKTPQNFSTVIELERRPQHLWAFTTGVYLAGIKSKEHSILTNIGSSNDTSYSIVQSDGSSVEAGINALMHIGTYINNSDIGWFGSFGPGLSLENKPRPRILIGTGLIFGRTNKIAFSVGFIGGPERQLASAYNTTSSYKVSPNKDDLNSDRFRGSWYFSLGYALFGK